MIRLMPRIVVDPKVRHGKPIIEGTRVPVHVIVGHVAAGEPIDNVAQKFGIAKEDVFAALAYAAQTIAAEEIRAV
jgi:uncharacterized protein (DUF433 family)